MAYSAEQRRIAQAIVRIGRRRSERPKRIVSALETGITESNLRNLSYGDGTSIGWRQETASSYPNVNRRNVKASINRYYNEARRVSPHGTAGQIAQAVQRSAFPARYDQHRGQALNLYRSLRSGTAVGGGGGGGTPGTPGSVSRSPQQAGGSALAQLTATAMQRQTGPPMYSMPAAPAFSAHVTLPEGQVALPPQSGLITPQQAPSVQDLLAAANQDANVVDARSTVTPGTPGTSGGGGGGAVSGARGRVIVASGADRAGVGVKPVVKRYLSQVAGLAHQPITITTGTNHNRLTVDGNVSDHWDGHAGDLAVPVDSHKGDVIATAALINAGVPRAKARAMARRGGLFTLNHNGLRIQVIWKTYLGGNHHNHVHVGVRPA